MKKTGFPLRNLLKKGLTLVIFLTIASTAILISTSVASGKWPKRINFSFPALSLACLALLFSWLVEGLRLKLIASSLGEGISFSKIIGINLATSFTGNITPFNSGGVPTQIILLCRNGLTPGKAGAIVTIRLVISTLLFTLSAPFLLFFYHTRFSFGVLRQVTTIAIPLAVILSLGLTIFIAEPKLVANLLFAALNSLKLGRLGHKIHPYLAKFTEEIIVFHSSIKKFHNWFNILLVFFLTIIYWVCFFAIAPFLMYAFGLNAAGKFVEIILLQFILFFILAYLPVPGGTGLMELSLYSVLVFIPLQFRAMFIFLWRFLSYHLSTFIGGFVLLRLINRPVKQSAVLPD